MILIVSAFFIRYFTPKRVDAVTIFPFIIIKHEKMKLDRVLINHERIHIRQQIELFLIFFIVFYYTEFIWKWISCGNADIAYRNISFEREAYENEANSNYLKTRKWFAFIKYW